MYHKIHKIHVHFTRAAVLLSFLIVLTSVVVSIVDSPSTIKAATPAGLTWKSGLYNNGGWENISANTKSFATWRGQPAGVVVTWPGRNTWAAMGDNYFYGIHKGQAYTAAIGLPMFPENISNSTGLQECAAGKYAANWKTIATTLKTNGLDKSIIRLGWEFNGDWYNHRASNVEQFKQCWRNVYAAAESVAPGLAWDWTGNRGNNMVSDVRTAYPGDDVVDIIGVDSYDFWHGARNETEWNNNQYASNYGLKWYLELAKSHGKKLSVPEWGVYPGTASSGTSGGDNPFYIKKMFEFFKTNAANIAYEAYFNENASYYAGAIYNPSQNPSAASMYASLYRAGVSGTTPTPTPTPPAPTPPPAPVPTPKPVGPGSYNDTSFTCSSGWQEGDGAGMYQNNNRYHNAKNAYCSVLFTGNKVVLYMTKNPQHGTVAVSIDGGAETIVDLYSPTRVVQFLAYTSPPSLSNGTHTVKMRITGDKHASASGTYVGLDRADISNNVMSVPVNPPTGVSAKATSATSVSLSWTKPAGTIVKYLIQRNGAVVGQTTSTSYIDEGRAAKTEYSYAVVAVSDIGAVSPPSSTVKVTTLDVKDTTPPTVPTKVNTVVASPTQVNISWSASTDNVSVAGYKIFRNGVQVANVSASTKSYGDTNLTSGKSYAYTVAAYDGANNVSAQSSPPSIISTPPASSPTSGGLTATYFSSKELSGTPLTRTDPSVNFNWGKGSPIPGIPTDLFSARWTGGIKIPSSGTYTFYTAGDDGIRLWVNGKLLVNDWSVHATREKSGTIKLDGGKTYNLKLEFYENKGDASARLLWKGPSTIKSVIPQQVLTPDYRGLTASFYNNPNLTGSPILSRVDDVVDFSWGNNSPATHVNSDNFSALWTGKVVADKAGEYSFTTISDDGVRLRVNGKLLINNWSRHSETANTGKITLAANSRNDIRLEFNDVAKAATIKLQWKAPGALFKTTVPTDSLRTR